MRDKLGDRYGPAPRPARLTQLKMPAAALDLDHLAAFLHAAARARESATYAEVLGALGFAFSRPKMRALCVALDAVDAVERGAGRPPLAVLVVRQSDRLPGQGWWLGQRDHRGAFTGPEAVAWVRARQAAVFDWWARNPDDDRYDDDLTPP